MWLRLVDMLHWLIHKNKNVSEKNGKGGEKKGVTHGPGYAGNGGIMRGVKTTMAATRHSSSNQPFPRPSRRSHDPQNVHHL